METHKSTCSYCGVGCGLIAQPDGRSLVSGPVIGESEVRCIEGHDKFIFFGWDNTFDDVSGLGRADLETFVDTLAPAYATDVMANQAGRVTSVLSWEGRRWFTVETGLYYEIPEVLEVGWLETGRITMNLADQKMAIYGDLRHQSILDGQSIELWWRVAGGDFRLAGVSDRPGMERPPEPFDLRNTRAIWHELRVVLTSGQDESPILTGASLASQIAPDRSLNIFLPILVHETVTHGNQDYTMDVDATLGWLTGLVLSQRPIRNMGSSARWVHWRLPPQ
jgi:hypothetical protein